MFIVCDRVEWYLSYLQKYRPELFGIAAKKDSARHVSAEALSKVTEVAVDGAEKWLKGGKTSPLIVDLRGALAFKAGHIAGSINIPVEQLEDLSEWGVPFSQNQRILFVCPVGDQSKRFAAFFGGKSVVCASLTGGFIAWRDAGKPIEKSAVAKK